MEIRCTLAHSLQRPFGPEVDDLGARTGVSRRRRTSGAMTPLRTPVLTVLKHPRATPADFTRTAAPLGVHVSTAAIAARVSDPLIASLRHILEHAAGLILAPQPAAGPLLQGFTAVWIGDGTTVSLPDDDAEQSPGCGGAAGSGRAARKIPLLWDVLAGSLRKRVSAPGKRSDAVRPRAREGPPAGSPSRFDPGYFCPDRFGRLMPGGAFRLSRLQVGAAVYDTDGRELSGLGALQGGFEAGQRVGAIPVPLGATHRLRCRLIAVRVPQEGAARRRPRAPETAATHGRAAPREYLRWQDGAIFVTHCEPERLVGKAVVALYRARWQIGLMFKLGRSPHGLAPPRPGASAPERLALIDTNLIGGVVQPWILMSATWSGRRRRLMKAAATVREWITNLAEPLDNRGHLVARPDRRATTLQGDCVGRRKKQPSLWQLLEDPELLDWRT